MGSVGFTELRRNLAEHLDRVESDRVELVVSRRNREDLAIIPLAELESLRETMHLLGTPANAARLMASVSQLDAGGGTERPLIEE
ncbi:type II toxin-antitoxin system Phd/YefM family antitoxin [Methylorubrum podarium]|jgi:antitoxin YefM|uniref:type II toxin-antitoxin system Phd/YefM family antitoxin n=1 Tax=Methylorubrum podarium TaxID=200476 RepID=UPI001EE26CE2|nr:type II toxin-antitoxin system prevent-host-death family antitoxin [Methylorubrum podarium]GJE70122.1 Antitoxin YefM [Methylorubrum podarium]